MDNYQDIRQFATFASHRGRDINTQFDVRVNNSAQITTTVLFNKMLNDLDAISVMVDEGFIDQSFVIMRTMLDKLFVLSALTKDESKMEELKKHFEYQQAGIIKKGCDLGLIDEDEKEGRLMELDGKNITASMWAEWAGMKETYQREYSLFSDFIHVSLKSIEDCLVKKRGKIKAIDMAPKIDRRGEILTTASYYVLLATEIICNYFKIKMPDQDKVENAFSRLSEPYFAERTQDEGKQQL